MLLTHRCMICLLSLVSVLMHESVHGEEDVNRGLQSTSLPASSFKGTTQGSPMSPTKTSTTTERRDAIWEGFPSVGQSQTYAQIVASVKTTFIEHRVSCRRNCGQPAVVPRTCSCKPYCYYFMSCCYDFFDRCWHLYSDTLNRHDYTWLGDVALECTGNGWMVSSCGAKPDKTDGKSDSTEINGNSTDGTENSPVNVSYTDANLNDNRSNTMDAKINDVEEFLKYFSFRLTQEESRRNISLSEYLYYLSILVTEGRVNPSHLSPFQSFLLSSPVLDSRTSIVYRNKSMFDCHTDGDVSDMTILARIMSSWPSLFLISDRIRHLDDLLSALDTSTWGVHSMTRRLLEPCIPGTISSCPSSFQDQSVREGCERIMLPLNVSYEEQSHIQIRYYKNPFCLICDEGMSNSSGVTLITHLDRKVILGATPVQFFSDGELTIELIRHSLVYRPNWLQLKCHLGLKEKELEGRFNETKRRQNGGVDDDANGFQMVQESVSDPAEHEFTCTITKCQGQQCVICQEILVALPKPSREMTALDWERFKRNLQAGLVNMFPQEVKIRDKPEVKMVKKTNNVIFRFDYRISIVFKLEVYIYSIDWLSVALAVTMSGYPFPQSQRYICGSHRNVVSIESVSISKPADIATFSLCVDLEKMKIIDSPREYIKLIYFPKGVSESQSSTSVGLSDRTLLHHSFHYVIVYILFLCMSSSC